MQEYLKYIISMIAGLMMANYLYNGISDDIIIVSL